MLWICEQESAHILLGPLVFPLEEVLLLALGLELELELGSVAMGSAKNDTKAVAADIVARCGCRNNHGGNLLW